MIDPTMEHLVQQTGLAGIIALMAYWALREVFKRIDRALDQMQSVIDKLEGGFTSLAQHTSGLAASINQTLQRIEEQVSMRGK